MEKLIDFITAYFKRNNILLVEDIIKNNPELKPYAIRQFISNQVKQNKLCKVGYGVYTLPKKDIFGEQQVTDPIEVITQKYILNDKNLIGYYSGLTILNKLGICNQIPQIKEIVTNKEKSNKRDIEILGQKLILRKPSNYIDNTNAYTMQFLDIMKNIDKYSDVDKNTIQKILKKEYLNKVTYNDLKKYINIAPDCVWKNIVRYDINEIFAWE